MAARTPNGFHRGLRGNLSRSGFSNRAVRFAASSSSYGTAPAADNGCAATLMAGLATDTRTAGTSQAHPHLLGCAFYAYSVDALLVPKVGTSICGITTICHQHLDVARASTLRSSITIHHLALPATFLFLQHGSIVLVPRREAVSLPATVVTLASLSISDSGRRAEHGIISSAHIL
jgi:hypothetical protein